MKETKREAGVALVTGGTGLLGSHIAEQLRSQDVPVRALCRPGSDTAFLRRIGVRIIPGDLADAEALGRACAGVDTVYHCAAKVGDWGSWREFVRVSIDGTRHLLAAAASARVRRFLHVSSISAYGHVNEAGRILDESAPLGVNLGRWSYYSRAKAAAEQVVWEMHRTSRLAVTVIRPSWLYGPRDRATLPRLIDSIRRGRLKLIGDGENRLNVVHAGNVAEAAVLAANQERAAGEAYNCSHDGMLTQRQYFNIVARTLGEPETTASVPYGVATTAALVMECFGHVFRTKRPPLVTRYAVWLMGRRCFFECRKIKEHLGWSSSTSYEVGIPAAVRSCVASKGARIAPVTWRLAEP